MTETNDPLRNQTSLLLSPWRESANVKKIFH